MSHFNRMFLALDRFLVLNSQQLLFPLDGHKIFGLFKLLLQFFVVSIGYSLIFMLFSGQFIFLTFYYTVQF